MNKIGAQPNGPGPSMAEQALFVNGKGTRLIGAADSPVNGNAVIYAAINRRVQKLTHQCRENENAERLGKVIGTAQR